MLHKLSRTINTINLPPNFKGDWESQQSPITWAAIGSSVVAYQPNGQGFVVIAPSKGSAYVAWRRIFRAYPEITFTERRTVIAKDISEEVIKKAI